MARSFFPKIINPPPEVQFVDRFISKRDTVTVVRPEIRTIFRTVTELKRDTIYVPKDFNGVGVISASPVKFERGSIVVTYFGLRDSAFVQDRFSLPRPTTSYYLAAVMGLVPYSGDLNLGFEAGYRYRKLTAYARATTGRNYSLITLGLRIRLTGVE